MSKIKFKILKPTFFVSFAKKKPCVPKGFTPKLGLGPVEPLVDAKRVKTEGEQSVMEAEGVEEHK
jgi:hypothetical protein